jgi:hypothetical protein
MRTELLEDGHLWQRIADPDWTDPLDPTFAQRTGGRWNPPDSYPTLYLNEDLTTARTNLASFVARWPYEPEDLRNDTGPVLVAATLPRRQRVADAHTPAGLAAAGLPASYPLEATGELVPHEPCRRIGSQAKDVGLRGVRCRSANTPDETGRELAWFPATPRSRATLQSKLSFEDWFWA